MISAKTGRHQALRRFYEAAQRDRNQERFIADVRQQFLDDRGPALSDRWSVAEMFEQFVPNGRELIRTYGDRNSSLYESGMNVDTAAFANIMGQWAFSATLEGYENASLIGDQLVTVIPTQFNGERIPGIARLGDEVEQVNEGQPYPQTSYGEEWVDTPETIKRGVILAITKEAIFFDRTGILQQEASLLGETVGINREKRILDVVCGITTIYRRNGQAAEATYQSDNTQSSNALVDWTSINTMDQLFNAMTDPTNGEPILITPKVLLVPKALENTANRIVNATLVRQGTNSGNNQTYTNGNQLNQKFTVISGQYVKLRTSSDTSYFYGDPKRAFAYMQNWPMQVIQAPANNELDFTSDIVVRMKVTERGAAAVRDRRYMAKGTP